MFYLGQSFKDAGIYNDALKCYDERIKMGGWSEEVYFAMYQKVNCLIKLNKSFEEIIAEGTKAYQFRPIRAEVLYSLIKYFRETKKYHLGYMYSKTASTIKQPKDILFVDTSIYKYKILDELALCSYWIGNYKESKEVCDYLLTLDLSEKDKQRIEQNRKFANDKL